MAGPFKVHVRSISLPSNPQPLAPRVDEILNQLRTSAASSKTPEVVCNSLRGLGDLYSCIAEELLCLPSNQQTLSRPDPRKWVEEELDQSIRLLDLCSSIQDNLVAIKDQAQDLSLAFRRNSAALESKKVQKDIKKCFRSMKQIQNKCRTIYTDEMDSRLWMVVRLLMEAKEISVSLFRDVLSSLSMPNSKTNKLSFISKILNQRKVTCENNLECPTEVESLEHMVVGLRCLFRQLVKTRVSLLNIISL